MLLGWQSGAAQEGLGGALDGPRQQAGPRWRGQLGQAGVGWFGETGPGWVGLVSRLGPT